MTRAQARKKCLALAGAEETFPFGPSNAVYKVAGSTSERFIDADDQCGGVKRLEFSQGRPVRGRREAAGSMRSRQGCPGLGIGQHADGRWMARVPQPDGDFGPILLHQELDQRRGIEVVGQRR